MHITLRQIEVFNAVVRHLNYTRAAEELHLSQPAVSMQIRQLEDSVGLPLFEQLGKQMFMTDAGSEMYIYSRNIEDLLNEADKVFADIKGLGQGELSISVATTASHFATRLLAAFSKSHEGITISLDVTNRETLQRQLENNERDLVIMGQPPEGLEVEADAFMENPLVMIAPSNHPLVGQKNIPLSHFSKESFVVRETGSGTRNAIKRFFDQHGVVFNMGIEMTSNEAIKQAVEAGLGLAVVSIHTLELELETNRIAMLDVQDFPIMRHWYVVHPKSKRLSPVAQVFREFVLKDAAATLQPSMSIT